jgi:hypothetical protein
MVKQATRRPQEDDILYERGDWFVLREGSMLRLCRNVGTHSVVKGTFAFRDAEMNLRYAVRDCDSRAEGDYQRAAIARAD